MYIDLSQRDREFHVICMYNFNERIGTRDFRGLDILKLRYLKIKIMLECDSYCVVFLTLSERIILNA